jgi:hypothetical protein
VVPGIAYSACVRPYSTRGHRFMSRGDIDITLTADSYERML